MKKDKTFSNWRHGAIHLNLPNGNFISTTWAQSSYSDNYNSHYGLELNNQKYKTDRIEPSVQSDTVEVMVDCSDKLLKRLEKKFNDGNNQPFGYLTFEQWLYLVNAVAKEKQ